MRKPDTYISVWFDDTSDEPGWIVDRCDEDDNSHTAKICGPRTAADHRRQIDRRATKDRVRSIFLLADFFYLVD